MSNPVGIVRQNAVAVGGFAPNVGRSGRLCRSPKADIAGNDAGGRGCTDTGEVADRPLQGY